MFLYIDHTKNITCCCVQASSYHQYTNQTLLRPFYKPWNKKKHSCSPAPSAITNVTLMQKAKTTFLLMTLPAEKEDYFTSPSATASVALWKQAELTCSLTARGPGNATCVRIRYTRLSLPYATISERNILTRNMIFQSRRMIRIRRGSRT